MKGREKLKCKKRKEEKKQKRLQYRLPLTAAAARRSLS
jgi:hypothetical protein